MMEKQSIPFGNAMGMKVAFCNAMAVDLTRARRVVWVSGQLSVDEQGKIIGKGDIRTQTEQCLKGVQSALEKLGATMDDVVQVTVFVRDMTGLKDIHSVRLQYFKEPYPTSTLVAVSAFVHPEALIEINAVAVI
jgi:enamine deaminase RidA (YjgF/YER057c/UK114 family)